MYQHEQDTCEHEVTITAIQEEINRSSSTKSDNSTLEDQSNEPCNNNTQGSEVESESNLIVNEQRTRGELQDSLLGETSPEPLSETTTNQQLEVITTADALQEINHGELLIPREEFTYINEHDSLEEIVIYDMVVEYQGIMTSKIQYEDEVTVIEDEEKKQDPRDIVGEFSSKTLTLDTSRDELEPTTISQVMISHEEEVSAQSFGERSDKELEEWTKVLNNRADDEQWVRDGVHEDDMALITKDRSDPPQPTTIALAIYMGTKKLMTPQYLQPSFICIVNHKHQ